MRRSRGSDLAGTSTVGRSLLDSWLLLLPWLSDELALELLLDELSEGGCWAFLATVTLVRFVLLLPSRP